MASLLGRYAKWLHTGWPAGTVEKLPLADEFGQSNVPGLYIVGDLTGIPLLKFSVDTGARAVQHIAQDAAFQKRTVDPEVKDLVVVGGGVSGYAAAMEAKARGFSFTLYEAAQPFSTIANFPKGKPIYTYPTEMTPAGSLQFHEQSSVKEGLLDDLTTQVTAAGIEPARTRVEHVGREGGLLSVHLQDGSRIRAHRVIVAIGRSGNFRKLGVPGEDLDKVMNRLHDPKDFTGQNAMVVGGGDSAVEAAIALTLAGAHTTLVYRKPELARPKPENQEKLDAVVKNPHADVAIEEPTSERVTTAAGPFLGTAPGTLTLRLGTQPTAIAPKAVTVKGADGTSTEVPNDVVFSMIGREPPLDFFRRSGVRIRGEWSARTWIGLAVVMLFCFWVYHWKTDAELPVKRFFEERGWFPFGLQIPAWNAIRTLGDVVLVTLREPGFYYSSLYCGCVAFFGIARIRRRKTPYITLQTTTLMLIQIIPLFVLPYFVFPWMGAAGLFDDGFGKTFADALFPVANYGHGREYWRAFGLILAWPLFLWNVFNWQGEPLYVWLALSLVQTFVVIPILVWRFGKGAYCGWLCSCGALAETLGDTHRHKMPHGPKWNRLNFIGQIALFLAFGLLLAKAATWLLPAGSVRDAIQSGYGAFLEGKVNGAWVLPVVNYKWFVDIFLAGILGVGLYFHFSGRVWCRFACPLAALMHIYARFSQFRILSDKKKCISCNVCTSVCHQGIDIMSFANKGLPMEDPQCVRCSACVQSCPTGVLTFGRVDRQTGQVLGTDRLIASPVQLVELKRNRAP